MTEPGAREGLVRLGRVGAVQWLRALFMVPVPGRQGPGQGPGPAQLDRPGAQSLTPGDLTHVPTGERDRIVDHHH